MEFNSYAFGVESSAADAVISCRECSSSSLPFVSLYCVAVQVGG
mgnify:CR=1 FL=1